MGIEGHLRTGQVSILAGDPVRILRAPALSTVDCQIMEVNRESTGKSKPKDYKSLQGATKYQQNRLDLSVQGKTDQEVADAVGVHRVTVTKWRNYDPYFQAELNKERKDLWSREVERLRAMLGVAVDAIRHELEKGNPRVALQLLKLVGVDKIGEPTGQTDPEAIVDDLARARWTGSVAERRLHQLTGNRVSDKERQAVLEELDRKLAEDSEPGLTLID